MKHSWFEVLTGLATLCIAAGFFLYVVRDDPSNNASLSKDSVYTAHFSTSRGIEKGSEVRIRGVTVGEVQNVTIDTQVFEVVVTFTVSGAFRLPFDSLVSIESPLLLGDPYLTVTPGSTLKYLQSGDRIVKSRAAPSFEELLERAVFIVGDRAG